MAAARMAPKATDGSERCKVTHIQCEFSGKSKSSFKAAWLRTNLAVTRGLRATSG